MGDADIQDDADDQVSLAPPVEGALAEGSLLLLSDAFGARVDSIHTGQVISDVSRGRQPDGGPELHYFAVPTPKASNDSEPLNGFTSPPIFSLPGGLYQGQVVVYLYSPDPTATIRWTGGGSTMDRIGAIDVGKVGDQPARCRDYRPLCRCHPLSGSRTVWLMELPSWGPWTGSRRRPREPWGTPPRHATHSARGATTYLPEATTTRR